MSDQRTASLSSQTRAQEFNGGRAAARVGERDRGRTVSAEARSVAQHLAAGSAVRPAVQMARGRPQRDAARRQWGQRSRYGRLRVSALRIPLNVRQLGNRLRRATARAGGPVGSINNYVYVGTSRGRVTYVGISNNPRRRQHGHGARFHLHILNANTPLSRIEVRAIEQALIVDLHGNPAGQNIANSIAAHHPYYPDAIAFGRAFARWAFNIHLDGLRF